jgi:hypothetical protein
VGRPHYFQQVAANLLTNAIRFIPRAATSRSRWFVRECAVIRVQDDGPGIDPEFLPHLFESFQRGNPKPARRQSGLGLGLAIVRHLVELHGGTVTATNRAGRGALFEVRLQLAGTRPENGSEPSDVQEAGSAPINGSLDGLRVLLVEMIPTPAIVARDPEWPWCEPDITRRARSPDAVRGSPPDLVISDITAR